jgi:filamentous hemagglutinin family protein
MRGIKVEVPLQQQIKFLTGRLCFSVVCLLTIFPANAEAQITPDGTLPTVVEEQDNMEKITGGEREGNNLFHSFEEFSIPEGIEAIFENGLDVENIFTRITGESASTINGILKTQGSANFFLVNPNGIVFGENAQLDVGGSFIATTADSIQFEDGIEFSAKNAESKPILTVSVPIGLGFTGDNGAIQVNGTGNQINSESPVGPIKFDQRPSGLSVPSNQTFALVGNGVTLNGGVISARDNGQIYLNSINSGLVNINQAKAGFTLTSDNVTEYQDINLNQQSLVDASGDLVGNVFITGKNINILDRSFVLSQNQGNLSTGSLNIQSSKLLTISGGSPGSDVRSGIRSENFDTGKGADINISANQISLQKGARIRSNSFSEALGGNIDINAANSIQFSAPSSLIATTFADGDAGNISLSTPELLVDSSGISSSTNGAGNGGTLEINADLIEITGTSRTDRASISTTSFADGNAGNLIINTDQLRVIDGASLSSSSFGNGNAGNLSVEASELVEIKGISSNLQQTSNPQSTIRAAVQSVPPAAQKALGLPSVPGGDGGDVAINTPLLDIAEGVISVENQGTGNGGTLSVDAKQINLAETGRITAATESGLGGNININSENLQIDSGSDITAAAKNDGDGGNITIKTATLVAKKNSEVIANASQGQGGNIDINAEGLFLFDSPENIFSASSELGIDGEVNINTTIDFSSFEPISPEFIVAEEALQGSCFARRNSRQGSFVYGGAGGLPVSPSSAIDEESSLSSQLPEVQLNSQTSGSSDLGGEDSSAAAETVVYPAQTAQKWQVGEPIIEPTNLIKTADGRLLWVRKQVDDASSLICQ